MTYKDAVNILSNDINKGKTNFEFPVKMNEDFTTEHEK